MILISFTKDLEKTKVRLWGYYSLNVGSKRHESFPETA